MKKVNQQIVAQIHERQFGLEVQMIKDDNLDYFHELEKLINKYEVAPLILGSFKVGEVFNEQYGDIIIHYGDMFKTLFLLQDQTLSVPINVTKLNPLRGYAILCKMDKSDFRKNVRTKTTFDKMTLWIILYLLIIKPELGQKYLNSAIRTGYRYVFYVAHDNGRRMFVSVIKTRDRKHYGIDVSENTVTNLSDQVGKVIYLY